MPSRHQRISCRSCRAVIRSAWVSISSIEASIISALVLAAVMFVIALDVGWIVRLGAALAGRVGVKGDGKAAHVVRPSHQYSCSFRWRFLNMQSAFRSSLFYKLWRKH